MPYPLRCWENRPEVYWQHRSEWKTVFPSSRGSCAPPYRSPRRPGMRACDRPLHTRPLSWCSSRRPLPGRRIPPRSGYRVISPTHFIPGFSAVDSHLTRSGRESKSAAGTEVRTLARGWTALQAHGPHEEADRAGVDIGRFAAAGPHGPFDTRRKSWESLNTHSIKALSYFLRRSVLDGSRPSQE